MNVNQWLNINIQLFVIITFFFVQEILYYNLDDQPFCNNYIFSVVVGGGGEEGDWGRERICNFNWYFFSCKITHTIQTVVLYTESHLNKWFFSVNLSEGGHKFLVSE